MSGISVIIPSYNHARYLRTAIKSVLSQTCLPDEIIIVDDGSKDNSLAVARDMARSSPLLKIVAQHNRGAHHALNRGIELAAGPYIAVLNSDDLFPPHKLERCLQLGRRQPHLELIAGKVAIIDGSGERMRRGIAVDWLKRSMAFYHRVHDLAWAVMNENFITTTSNLYFTKALWAAVGGFQELRYCHDFDFILAALRRGRVKYDESMEHVHYRIHERNTIAEELRQIRIEIGGTIAVHMVESRVDLWTRREKRNLRVLQEVLNNKNLNRLLVVLLLRYYKHPTKRDFYAHLVQARKRRLYEDYLD